jgi:UDP-glucose 4-epimerase
VAVADNWVMTGGAGYGGGHVVAALHVAGVGVVVLDDPSTGRADRLPPGVVHLAAPTSAPESVRSPLAYHRADVTDVVTLRGAMAEHGVPRLVARRRRPPPVTSRRGLRPVAAG